MGENRRYNKTQEVMYMTNEEMLAQLQGMMDAQDRRLDGRFSAMDEKFSAIDEKFASMEQHVDEKLEGQTVKISLLLENEVSQKIGSIYDKPDSISEKLDRMPTSEDMEIANGRIDVLESIVKKLSRDVAELKKAN